MTDNSYSAQDNDDIKHLEALVVGSGSADFRKLEQMVDVFCPFEATGMVRQEIKHSNFLSYILNPNRPHVFGVHFLEEFLALITEQSNGQSLNFSRMDLHFMDLTNAITKREWKHIDILIELPSTNAHKKGIVVAVELKIDAGESEKQLADYKETIETKYHLDKWDHAFVFLTKDGMEASEGNEEWISLGLDRVISSFESIQKSQSFIGASSELFSAYANMMRRHILENREQEALAKKLWKKHPEALNVISDYKPNFRTEVNSILQENLSEIAEYFSGNNYKIVAANSTARIFRFIVENWQEIPEMSSDDTEWLDHNSWLAIEILSYGSGSYGICFTIDNASTPDKIKLFDTIKEQKTISIHTRGKTLKNFTHLSLQNLYQSQNTNNDVDAITIAQKVVRETKAYLLNELPKFNSAICATFNNGTNPIFFQKTLKNTLNQQPFRLTHKEKPDVDVKPAIYFVKKLWSKHPEALDILYNHKPNLRTDIVDILFSDLQSVADKIAPVGYSLSATNSSRSYLRFSINNWRDIKEMRSGNSEFLACKSSLIIEIYGRGEGFFYIKYLIGPSLTEDRERIFRVTKSTPLYTKKNKAISPTFQSLFVEKLLSKENEYDYDAIAETEKLLLKIKKYLEKTLPVLDEAIQKEFCKPKHYLQVTSTPLRA